MADYSDYALFVQSCLLIPKWFISHIILPPYQVAMKTGIDFNTRYLLDSPLGRIYIRYLMNPSLVYILNRFYDNRKLMRFFQHTPSIIRQFYAVCASSLNNPILNDPLSLIISNTSVVYCGVMYGQTAREEAFNFFNFLQKKNGDSLVGGEMLTGNLQDIKNIFFPQALSSGIKDINSKRILNTESFKSIKAKRNSFSKEEMIHLECNLNDQSTHDPECKEENTTRISGLNTEIPIREVEDESETEVETQFTKIMLVNQTRIEISLSCLLFSVLSYNTDCQIQNALNQNLLSGVEHYSLETGQSGTSLACFLSKEEKFAVFSFRGTQFEVMRQMLTSLDFRLDHFETYEQKHPNAKVRKVYLQEVQKACSMSKFKQKISFDDKGIPVHLNPMQLIRKLEDRSYKIYITGHSLGGGLAQILAAKLMAEKIRFQGVITFGATPVGNHCFVTWFKECQRKNGLASWRFVYGKEFAPLVPPIPFVEDSKTQELVHIDDLIHFIPAPNRFPTTPCEIEQMLGELTLDTGLVKTLVDHNPMMIRRSLQHFRDQKKKLPLLVGLE
eukprot:snap_masked-scaffold_67-processed-gene-0.71-mRNA-1 protein AED:1.00 eAED:1.00 QI:0/-1/0/0/-1/1/1/0/557